MRRSTERLLHPTRPRISLLIVVAGMLLLAGCSAVRAPGSAGAQYLAGKPQPVGNTVASPTPGPTPAATPTPLATTPSTPAPQAAPKTATTQSPPDTSAPPTSAPQSPPASSSSSSTAGAPTAGGPTTGTPTVPSAARKLPLTALPTDPDQTLLSWTLTTSSPASSVVIVTVQAIGCKPLTGAYLAETAATVVIGIIETDLGADCTGSPPYAQPIEIDLAESLGTRSLTKP